MSEAQAVLRRSLVPGLLRAADTNLRRAVRDVRLFEVGHVFAEVTGGISETSRAGIAWAGAAEPRHWSRKAADVTFSDAAGLVDAVLSALRPGLPAARRPASLPGLHPGQAAEWIEPQGRVVARAGRVHPELAERLDLEAPVYVAEVEVGLLAGFPALPLRGGGVPRLAPVSRDLALVLPADRAWAEVSALLRSVPAPAEAAFEVVDRYGGPPLPEDRISLTVRVILQPFDRSLTDPEIEGFRKALADTLQAEMGIALRA